jgi:diguanylate cyclase (GGDEF)-like protein
VTPVGGAETKPARNSVVRISIAALVVGLTALATFALAAEHRVVNEAKRADAASRLATVYQDARFWVGQDESLERKYRLEPTQDVLDLHEQSGDNLIADLKRVAALDDSTAVRDQIARLLQLHREYEAATSRMFAATRAGSTALVKHLDHAVTDPIFGVIQTDVYGTAAIASRRALNESSALRRDEGSAFRAGLIAVILAVGLVGLLSLVIRRYRRADRQARAAELQRLSELVVTDPLTGLRNHRAFHEDLANEMQRTARSGAPLALVLMDVNGLKQVNDTHGHQVGDEHLTAVGRVITSTMRGSDRAYRIGGDEFAAILPAVGEWAGFRFAQRLQGGLERLGEPVVRVSAGISEATELRSKDEVIHDADRALISAKRSGQAAALYTPDMGDFAVSVLDADEHQVRVLANALALAVDAKDPYTQSHCQTVSNLCAAIGAELGFDGDSLSRLRLAGLLHDVGKIGIPDAILRKPAKLTAAEYEEMKTHSVLGENIVLAAEMPERARWVRHHHERIDGFGYPDGLADREIPLESRIIHVADAFEAMTSDRPYRKAPGEQFAVDELRRNAGTQFDEDVVNALLRVLGDRSSSEPLAARLLATGRATAIANG